MRGVRGRAVVTDTGRVTELLVRGEGWLLSRELLGFRVTLSTDTTVTWYKFCCSLQQLFLMSLWINECF